MIMDYMKKEEATYFSVFIICLDPPGPSWKHLDIQVVSMTPRLSAFYIPQAIQDCSKNSSSQRVSPPVWLLPDSKPQGPL